MRRLLALVVAVPLGLGASACGSAGKSASPSHAATGGEARLSRAQTTAHSSKLDKDNDKDNQTRTYYDEDDDPVLRFGHTASAAEERQMAKVLERYYRAAAAGDGAAACSLFSTVTAESAAEGAHQAPGRSGCAAYMSKLFEQRRRWFAAELPALAVKTARVEGARGWAILSFGASRAPGRMLMHREGSAWTIREIVRNDLP